METPNNCDQQPFRAVTTFPPNGNTDSSRKLYITPNPPENHLNARTKPGVHYIHWRVPTLMAGSFFLGLGMAITHHLYNRSLDNTVVQSNDQQVWATRIGTALAFLTKTFLTASVGIACIQNLWWTLRLNSVQLSTLDSMFGIMNNIFNFFDASMWLRGPNVVLLGAIVWLIPLVAIVTPATLSIQLSPETIVSKKAIPTVDFSLGTYAVADETSTFMLDGVEESAFGGPQIDITRIVLGTAVQGEIAGIAAPAPNASYTLSFYGPSLQCNTANTSVIESVNNQIHQLMENPIGYIGFVLGAVNEINLNLTFGSEDRIPTLDESSFDSARIFVGAGFQQNFTVVECGLQNTSYTVDFNFDNGDQSLEITNLTHLNGVPPIANYTQFTADHPNTILYQEEFAYMAIMEAIGQVLVGYCVSEPLHAYVTQVLSTSLVFTNEMQPVINSGGGETEPNLNLNRQTSSLASAIEQLSRNITLSLFSSPYYLQNASQSSLVDVSISQSRNKFVYSQKHLLIAYGSSILASLLGIILGLIAILQNRLSFSNSFSTILRTTRNPELNEIVQSSATSGADPLPKYLARMTVRRVQSTDDFEEHLQGFVVSESSLLVEVQDSKE